MNRARFLILLLLLFSCPLINSSLPLPTESQGISDNQDTTKRVGLKLVGQVGGPTNAVTIQGKFAYTGIGMRVVVLDVSNPKKIRQVGSSVVMDGFVTGIFILKKKAYVTVGGAGLYILDLNNPRKPRELGFYDTLGYPENIVVKGKYAYIADGWAGLIVIDISNSKKPAKVGAIGSLGYTFDIVVAESLAYTASGGSGLKIIDIKDPQHPVEIGRYDSPGYAYGLTFSEVKKLIYLADGWEGIRIIDVADSYNPRPISSYKTPGWAFGAALDGSSLFVADAFMGLSILNISNPLKPKYIGAFKTDRRCHVGKVVINTDLAFAVDKNHAYIAAGHDGFSSVNISDSSLSKEEGFFDTRSYATNVIVIDQYAYVATMVGEKSGLYIFNHCCPIKKCKSIVSH